MASRFSFLNPSLLSGLQRAVCLLGALGGCLVLAASYFGPTAWLPYLAPGAAVLLLLATLAGTLLKAPATDLLATLPSTAFQQGRALLDAGGRVLEADPGFAHLLQRPTARLLHQPLRALLPETLWTELLKRAQRERDSTAPITIDVAPASAKQDQRALRCSFEAHRSAAGEVLWLLTLLDVSSARATAASRAAERDALNNALHAATAFSLVLSPSGQILEANPRYHEQLAGGADADLPKLSDLILGPASNLNAKLRAVIETGRPLTLKSLRLKLPHRSKREADEQPRLLELDARVQLLPQSNGEHRLLLTAMDLTALNARQRHLKQRNQLLESLYAGNPQPMLLLRDSDGTALDCNPAFTELLGYDLEALKQQQDVRRQLWWNELERQNTHELLASTGGVTGLQTSLRHSDGASVVVELSLRAVELAGEPCTLYCARNISDQLAQAHKLRASETKFERMFNGSPDAIAIVRVHDGKIIEVNPALGRLLGYPRNALVGQSCFDSTINPLDLDTEPLFQALDAESAIDNTEVTLITRNGSKLPALASATMIELDGELHVLAVAKDMRELQAVQSRLQRIEARFRGAFENAQLALLLLDMDGRIFETNGYARELLAFTETQFDGLHVSRLLPPEDRTRLKGVLSELQNRGEGCVRSERRLLCQNGLELWTNFQIVLQNGGSREDSYFIIQATDITDVKVSQRRMERMAFYDTLTDLANRRLFTDRLRQAVEHCERHGKRSALLYLDLDQFKRVNDTLGHEAGDALLQEAAHRLTECVRTEDTVGRMGGDEFTVLLYDVQHGGDAGVVASKILKRLSEPMQLSGHQLVVSASIGVTVIPEDGSDPTALMKNADLAMYRAKERGRNNFQFFSEDMNAQATRVLRVENELREGLARSEFVLYHQPKYRMEDGSLSGVECLVRWQHPERGLVGPVEFIDVAEETGAIVPLGSWIIEAACEAAKTFAALSQRPFVTAVNISPRQFRDPNLVNTIRRCLRTYDLDPAHLQVEITETMLMQDVAAAEMTVARLHELGLQLAIDDFGTGYSSLNYLKRFPINTVKVDRSFVKDIPGNEDDCAITAAVIAMAHRLQMEVVAEGVETQEQINFLRQHGCEYAQGYHYSKPVPMDSLKGLIAKDNLKLAPKVLVSG